MNSYSYLTDESSRKEGTKGHQFFYSSHKFENSISIESSDEDNDNAYYNRNPDIYGKGKIYSSESDFQKEISKLKLQSTLRFRDKWDEILHKYSQINDDKESDEIDLVSGKIIIDNGHLKSLRDSSNDLDGSIVDDNIWSASYDLERDIAVRKQKEHRDRLRKRELRLKLKEKELFYNSDLHKNPSPLKNGYKLKDSSKSSNHALEDNLLLLNPSPTKKARISPIKITRESSPFKVDDLNNLTPTRSKNSSISSLCDTTLNREASNYFFDRLESETNQLRLSSSSIENLETALSGNVNPRFHSSSFSNKYDKKIESNTDFDDEYSIISNDLLLDHKEKRSLFEIFQCPFEGCHYCTGNKSIFQSHLLENHKRELHSIGYPVAIEENYNELSPVRIPTCIISKITEYFPLTHRVPPLPLSKNGQVFKCNLVVENRECERFFLSKSELNKHQEQNPKKCSFKKQVLICPLLGCGYMTDEGYLEFRSHFINSKHHVKPKLEPDIDASKFHLDTKISNGIKLESLSIYSNDQNHATGLREPISKIDLIKEINDIFSSSESELDESLNNLDNEFGGAVSDHENKQNKYSASSIPEGTESDQENSSDALSEVSLSNFRPYIYENRNIKNETVPHIDEHEQPTYGSNLEAHEGFYENEEYDSIDEFFRSP